MTFPARIHALLARDAPLGVVIRRGPAKSVCTIEWDRRRDAFKLGQWLRGRIYERRSDLSPDGKHLIYFAMNGKWNAETKGSWTAISRAPYLKAISLFSKGDCWQGGGLFTTPNQYWLNGGGCHAPIRECQDLIRDTEFVPTGGVGGECLGIYYPRLLRDGWRLIELGRNRLDCIDVFEKPAGQEWILRKLAHSSLPQPVGKNVYWDSHALVHHGRELHIEYPDWEWAEVDGSRLVWAAGGALYAGRLTEEGLQNQVKLADFSGMKFEAIAAPY